MKCSGNIVCLEVDNDIVEAKVTLLVSFNEIENINWVLRAYNEPCLFSDLPFNRWSVSPSLTDPPGIAHSPL